MKPGDLELVPADERLSLDEGAPLDPADSAMHDEEFRAQRQKIQRLNQYYDEVVAELRALLDSDRDEAAWIRSIIDLSPSASGGGRDNGARCGASCLRFGRLWERTAGRGEFGQPSQQPQRTVDKRTTERARVELFAKFERPAERARVPYREGTL
jgi:hypothetical protein